MQKCAKYDSVWGVSMVPKDTTDAQGELVGMPAPCELRLDAVGDNVVVSYGGRALTFYERGDRGMRNLAIVSLTRAGVSGVEVARLFGICPEHVSRLRRQVSEGGSRALLPAMGRPRKLDRRAVARAYEMSDQGAAGSEIARALGVSEATISRLLGRRPARETERLALTETDTALAPDAASEVTLVDVTDAGETTAADMTAQDVTAAGETTTADMTAQDVTAAGETTTADMTAQDAIAAAQMTVADAGVASVTVAGEMTLAGAVVGDGGGVARIGVGGGRSLYAGAMLLHGFLDRVGAGGVFEALGSGARDAMTRPRSRWRARSRSRWEPHRLRAASICSSPTRACWSGSSASRICGRCVRG